MDGTALKTDRILKIYSQLVNGDILRKKELDSNIRKKTRKNVEE